MNAVGRLGNVISTVSGPFHPFGGAIDIIVVEQPDGTFKSSPWYVRFGKFQGVLKTKEKEVKISVNGVEANLKMYLDHRGGAYFLREIGTGDAESVLYPLSLDEANAPGGDTITAFEPQTCKYEGEKLIPTEKIVARTDSQRSGILGLLFGRGPTKENGPGDDLKRASSMERAEIAAKLLEMRWSTNLAPSLPLKDSNDGMKVICSVHDLVEYSHSDNPKSIINEASLEMSTSGSTEQETMRHGESSKTLLQEKGEVISEISRKVDELNGGSDDINTNPSLPTTTVLPSVGMVGEEDEADRVKSYLYCETTESLMVSLNAHEQEADEDLYFNSEGNEEDSVFKEPSTVPESTTQVQEDQTITISSSKPPVANGCVSISGVSEQESESSDEEQFLFSDIQYVESSSQEMIIEDDHRDLEKPTEKSRTGSSPIVVSTSQVVIDEDFRRIESLPELWSPSRDIHTAYHSPISQSLDPKTLVPAASKQDSDSDKLHLANQQPQLEEREEKNSRVLEYVLANPEVELSLCKHLLHEGMGAGAASQAFDSKKLDIEQFSLLGPSIVENDKLVVRIFNCYFPWEAAAPIILGIFSFGSAKIFEPKGMIAVDKSSEASKATIPGGGSWRLWPFSLPRSRSRTLSDGVVSQVDTGELLPKPKMVKKMTRAITPISEELASLNLKEGKNIITFTFFTPMLGEQQVDATIYLWKWNTRIVISDVDGTITRSDILGQFMPLMGVDWNHTGVAHLFSAIQENGYQMLFLSARAISQASLTRHFLFNLKQDGKALPEGPVVISPDGLFPSLFREVIRRAPHEFKIACLEDIKALFPPDYNPFYAGFGNRDTDEISYLKVGIPRGKIFIINPKGEVAVSRRVHTGTYPSLHALVNGMFPVMTTSEQEDYNSWNYWKLPPPLMEF